MKRPYKEAVAACEKFNEFAKKRGRFYEGGSIFGKGRNSSDAFAVFNVAQKAMQEKDEKSQD